ncbi:MAG: DNA/RNA non-specific endonuclease [Alphaproteobacteria bacterium]|nr:DNA/RNA non-specific endonuclease [Alphaproteobacteria bacterium]
MPGYDPNFLKTTVSIPTFSFRLQGRVLQDPDLRDGVYRDYIHYSLAMHDHHRSPIFTALNIDQAQLKSVGRSKWEIDNIVGFENQLDNAYYYRNRWDRGHLARRASAAWGPTNRAAKQASDATMFFTNACLQFDAYNQDEWLDLENWVKNLKEDAYDRISVFSGPIYGDDPLTVTPEDREPAEVPAAFFKVVCFDQKIDNEIKLAVRAFIVPQDQKAMEDWKGSNRINHQTYQTTVAEIEDLTGIEFPEIVAETNPLLFNENADARANLNVTTFPENRPVNRSGDITDPGNVRTTIADEDVDVFIAAAMPNPAGADRGNEWVALINLEPGDIDLTGWTLIDNADKPVELSGTLAPGETMVLKGDSLKPIQLGNQGDILTLFDRNGRRIDRVRYVKEQVKENKVVLFPRRPPAVDNVSIV